MSYKKISIALLGSAILAFGLCHIHSYSEITEGGVLGLTLIIQNKLSVSPAVSGMVMNVLCYLFGIKTLGRRFLAYSAVSVGGFSLFYSFFDCFEPIFPWLSQAPLAAALLGALFVGVGVGLCVRVGGAPTGDDALAMGLSRALRLDIRIIYFVSDILVLLLSLSYIPLGKILYSLLSVTVSTQLVGLISQFPKKKSPKRVSEAECDEREDVSGQAERSE